MSTKNNSAQLEVMSQMAGTQAVAMNALAGANQSASDP